MAATSPVAYAASGKRISLLNPMPPSPPPSPLTSRLPNAQLSTPEADLDELDHISEPPHPRLTRTKRYSCPVCLKTFSTSGHLTRHARIHSGQKEHPCPFPGCIKECSRHDNLVQHFRSHVPKADRTLGRPYIRRVMDQLRESTAQDFPRIEGPEPGHVLLTAEKLSALVPGHTAPTTSSSSSGTYDPPHRPTTASIPVRALSRGAPDPGQASRLAVDSPSWRVVRYPSSPLTPVSPFASLPSIRGRLGLKEEAGSDYASPMADSPFSYPLLRSEPPAPHVYRFEESFMRGGVAR